MNYVWKTTISPLEPDPQPEYNPPEPYGGSPNGSGENEGNKSLIHQDIKPK